MGKDTGRAGVKETGIRKHGAAIVSGLLGFLIGLVGLGFIALAIQGKSHEVPTIICPPMIDAADVVILHYPPDGGPEPTELDWEFAEACGFETIKGPAPVVPPPPEEGGA